MDMDREKKIRKVMQRNNKKRKHVFHIPLQPKEVEQWEKDQPNAPFEYNPTVSTVEPYEETSIFSGVHETVFDHDNIESTQTVANEELESKNEKPDDSTNNTSLYKTKENRSFYFSQYFDMPSGECVVPTHTSHHCWWCHHSFSSNPVGIPTKTKNNETMSFLVYGNFCSFSCAYSYLKQENLTTNTLFMRESLLQQMKTLFTGTLTHIIPAPDWKLLQKYGGPMSISDFRDFCNGDETLIHINQYPMISTSYQIDIKKQSVITLPKKTSIMLDKERVKKATQNVKLKRKNPVHGKVNTLEQCMNLSYS